MCRCSRPTPSVCHCSRASRAAVTEMARPPSSNRAWGVPCGRTEPECVGLTPPDYHRMAVGLRKVTVSRAYVYLPSHVGCGSKSMHSCLAVGIETGCQEAQGSAWRSYQQPWWRTASNSRLQLIAGSVKWVKLGCSPDYQRTVKSGQFKGELHRLTT